MADINCSPCSPNPRKRAAPDKDSPEKKPLTLTGTQFVMPTPPDTEESSNSSPTCTGDQQREGSPAPSISTMTSVDLSGSTNGANNTVDLTNDTSASSSKPPPAKRRKLTPSEKLEKQREKESKEREKAEKKAQKDEEKRLKDEEKRVKNEEKESKKREKELAEERRAQEKLKKERAQMRLGAFFQKPATPAKSPGAVGDAENPFDSARRKSLSLEPFDAVADQIRRSASPTKGQTPIVAQEQKPVVEEPKPPVSDYQKFFLPFELPSHSTLAATYDIPNPDDLAYWQGAFDDELKDPSFQEKVDLGLVEPTAAVDHMFKTEQGSRRGMSPPDMCRLFDQVRGTSTLPIDLTQDATGLRPIDVLQAVPRRLLHFEEDVRPPYFGTYTKIRSPRSKRKLMLNPFSRTRPDTNYDEDSEAEWEEPEEGEELLDEEDEAESLPDADEMDGFLDDEDDPLKHKRKVVTSDLQAFSTGLCWENQGGTIVQSIEDIETVGTPKEMRDMCIGVLIPGFSGQTIDPFSTAYWVNDMAPPGVPISDAPRSTSGPGRPPLQERHSNGNLSQSLLGAAEGEKGPITSVAASQLKRGPKPQPRTLSKEDLEEFKEAVVGSPLGKIELCKGLKARFKKMTNETIKETLSSQFAQVGATKADKKWVFVAT